MIAPDNYHIRRLSRDDLLMFMSIRLEALERSPASFASHHTDWVNLSEAQWLAHLSKPVVVALVGYLPIGIMTLTPRRPKRTAHRATLGSVYVREEWRSAGVGQALLSTIEEIATAMHINQLELSLIENNQRALRFYQRCGFSQVGMIPNGYIDGSHGTDEIIMVKSLSSAGDVLSG
jgi:ribosomal protein S18 acetylase RimI-like enzyme